MFKIIEKTFSLKGSLKKRSKTEECILHHRAGNGTVESIDAQHKKQGWTCIGYHFYITKDGLIYRGRREDTIGAHATGHNSKSIGICFEGNFETDIMSEAQKQAGIWLIHEYLKPKYNFTKILKHKDVAKTACPGKNFPFDEIVKGTSQVKEPTTKSVEEVAKEVIAGIWGNSPNRKANLEKAGYNYKEVQNKVNELVGLTKPKVSYYPKCSGLHISIVSALNSIGVDSSKEHRKKIAKANGINNYSFSFSQNVKLLNLLKTGKLIKV